MHHLIIAVKQMRVHVKSCNCYSLITNFYLPSRRCLLHKAPTDGAPKLDQSTKAKKQPTMEMLDMQSEKRKS